MISITRGFNSGWLRHFALFGLMVSVTASADVTAVLETCASCHGKDGASTESDVPIIGGYSAKYLADSLANYKNKARPCPEVKYPAGAIKGQRADMCAIAGKLSDADTAAISDYMSTKPFVRAKQAADA